MRASRISATVRSALLATALVLQVGLLWAADTASATWLIVIALPAVALIVVRSRAAWRGDALDAALVAACLGGLGMLVGGLVDARSGAETRSSRAEHAITSHAATTHQAPSHEAPSHQHHAHEAASHGTGWRGAIAHLASWSTVGMLVLCVPSCLLLCPGPAPTRCHALSTLGMLAGMVVAGALLAPTLTAALDSSAIGSHLAMLLGMSAGTALGLASARIAVRRARLALG